MNKQIVNIKSTEFQPQNEYMLIKPAEHESEKTTDAGIIIPLNALQGPQGRQAYGVVVAKGEDITKVDVSDTVFFPNTDGIDFEFLDGDFTLIRLKSIIGSKKK